MGGWVGGVAAADRRAWRVINVRLLSGPYNLMLKYLQKECHGYFGGRTYSEAYSALSTSRQRATFYSMLLCAHLTSATPNDSAVAHLAESAAGRSLDLGALMGAVWGVALQVGAGSEEGRRLTGLVGVLQARGIVERTQLLTDLPDWVCQGAGLVEGAAAERRLARVYTKINYEQSKHSLLRENNEGYAKVALLLANLKDTHDLTLTWHRMLDLVGNFDLDPDRVLDLLVEARVRNFNTAAYLRLLQNFRRESIAAVLGNKLRVVRGKAIEGAVFEKVVYAGPLEGLDAEGEAVEAVVSPHLVSLCAELVKRGAVEYEDLLAYLEPGDHAIRHVNSRRVELAMAKVKECFTLSMEELDEAEKAKLASEENLKFEGQLLHSTKLALIAELVRLNAWADFVRAWAPFHAKIDLLLYQPLLRNLLDLLEWAIDPLVQPTCYHRFFRHEKPFRFATDGSPKEHPRITALDADGLRLLEGLLDIIGKYIGLRPRAFIKLCRVLRRAAGEGGAEGRGAAVRGCVRVLVGGSCVAEGNAAMAHELFEVLDCYDYQFRYECYLEVYRGGMSECPLVARIFESIKRRQNIIVNNLSKENKKLFIRKISKLTHNQALPVFYWIVRRIVMEDYEAVVPEIVSVISNCSPLTLDVAIFVMLYTLNESREPPVNAKTHDCLPWFKNVTTFISNFFRKYLETDMQPVFDYIIMKTAGTLAADPDDDQLPGDLLNLLHELLNKMHGSVMISEVNKSKYDAMAAGPRLQAEILELTSEVRAAKKSKVFLQKFFWEKNAVHQHGCSLAFNLLVLLAQKRSELFTKCFVDDIKIVGEIFDEYSLLIVQVVRVLLYQAQDHAHYAQLLPADPLRVLLRDYKLPLEIACEVVRPGVKHIAVMTAEEWTQLTTDFAAAYAECLSDDRFLVKSSRLNEKWAGLLSAYKERVLEYIPKSFFTAFWFLTLDSVYFPAKSYAEKIDDLKKKLEPKRGADRVNEKEMERMRTLLEKLVKEEEAQRRKYSETLSPENLKKLEVDVLGSGSDKGRESIFIFAEQFVQTCLLPRMMLDRTEALYCVKFTVEMIKANAMAVTKSIRLLTYIIEYVMGYLPFTTHREASNCISVYLGELLAIFNNWNDAAKLKQDLSKILGVEEPAGKDNYPKLKDYLIKLFERVGNTLRGVKEEPYLIKNCLYILEKVDSIPSYKEQADELAQHMNELKELFPTVDMRTSLDRQIAILTAKKNELPDRPAESRPPPQNNPAKTAGNAPANGSQTVSTTPANLPPAVTTLPTPAANLTPTHIQHPPNNAPSNALKRQPDSKPSEAKLKPDARTERTDTKADSKTETKPEEKPAAERMVEERPPEKPKPSRFTEKPVERKDDARKNEPIRRPEIKNPITTPNNPQELKPADEKVEPKTTSIPPKTVKELREEMQRQAAIAAKQHEQPQPPQPAQPQQQPIQAPQPQPQPPQGAQLQGQGQGVNAVEVQNPSANPRQETKMTPGQTLFRSQRPASSIEPTSHSPNLTKTTHPAEKPQRNNQTKPSLKNQPSNPQNREREKADRERVEKREKPSPTPERKNNEQERKNDRWRDNKDNKDNNFKREKEYPRDRDNKEREREKPKAGFALSRERKSEERRDQNRKQEKRERSRERERQREREKAEKDKRAYEKHRDRSPPKYGRR